MKALIRLAVVAGVLFGLWRFGVPAYADWRISSAMVEAGVPEKLASCTSGRMVERLSVLQLFKLRALEGGKQTLREWRNALDEVGDPQIVRVAASSAALCSTGLAR